MKKIHKERLLKVVRALREAGEEPLFRDTFSFLGFGYSFHEEHEGDDEYRDRLEQQLDEEGYDSEYIPDIIDSLFVIEQKLVGKKIPHNCGAPACALGHFALRRDLQRKLRLTAEGYIKIEGHVTHGHPIYGPEMRNYFGLSTDEIERLFGADGCGATDDIFLAADYIEGFVNNYEKPETPPSYDDLSYALGA